jgi:hypothetical protein
VEKPQDQSAEIIYSPHSGSFDHGGQTVEVCIFRLEGESEWTLEVIDKEGNSTVWNEPFANDEVAWKGFLKTIGQANEKTSSRTRRARL